MVIGHGQLVMSATNGSIHSFRVPQKCSIPEQIWNENLFQVQQRVLWRGRFPWEEWQPTGAQVQLCADVLWPPNLVLSKVCKHYMLYFAWLCLTAWLCSTFTVFLGPTGLYWALLWHKRSWKSVFEVSSQCMQAVWLVLHTACLQLLGNFKHTFPTPFGVLSKKFFLESAHRG